MTRAKAKCRHAIARGNARARGRSIAVERAFAFARANTKAMVFTLTMAIVVAFGTSVDGARALKQQPERRWMQHLLSAHPEMQCTQIPMKPVVIGGDGGGIGKSLEEFLRDSNAVTFGPVDENGNSDAERLSGLDDIIVDIMAWAKRPLYEPDEMPIDLQVDVAKHLCDMFARQEKWLHPDLTTNTIRSMDNGRWGWKDPLAMYLLPIWRDVYGPTVTYIHLVRDPRTLPLGNLHDKERDLQRAYFGKRRWDELTRKFEEEWSHLSDHAQINGKVSKEDAIDLFRTTAYWTSVNFEIGALLQGPLRQFGMILRAEDLAQPDMDHFRFDKTAGKKLEKYQAAQKPIQLLTTLLKLPPKVSNQLADHMYVRDNLKRFTVYREKFTYRVNSPLTDVQTRIAKKALDLFGYETSDDIFVPDHPDTEGDHGHRLTPEDEYMHEEHKYTPDDWVAPPAKILSSDDHTEHVLGSQLKYTKRIDLEREKLTPKDTDQTLAVKTQLIQARQKNFILETTQVGGKSLKEMIDNL